MVVDYEYFQVDIRGLWYKSIYLKKEKDPGSEKGETAPQNGVRRIVGAQQ